MAFSGRRVLVVEDEFMVSLAMTDLLESIGCVIVGPAACLAAAVQLARSELLDAAVLDINIAGEMIWPVAEELLGRGVPFLFLSANPQQNAVPLPFAAIPRFDKPLEKDRLLRYLSSAWGDGEPDFHEGEPRRRGFGRLLRDDRQRLQVDTGHLLEST